eukprot:TRINITY_DN488_c0_g1_i23.p1 TRINITY_DN488_c0_g1~~TRINITY_DN488_c0_g1_i23.p1  ORF type:complete len:558 (+),score=114.53 TRINITY_DN488_c0_g1_i23:107-1780(+)
MCIRDRQSTWDIHLTNSFYYLLSLHMNKENCQFFQNQIAQTETSIWSIPTSETDITIFSNIVAAQTLIKYRKWVITKSISRHFCLTNKHLIYYKDSDAKQVKGYTPLDNLYISKIVPAKKNEYGFKIMKNNMEQEYFVNNKQQFEAFYGQLRKYCINTDFDNQYEMVSMVGQGSTANVYVAVNKQDQKKYAVKSFNKQIVLSEQKGRESLVNEINIIRQLSHQNVCQIHEVHETSQNIFMVMELMTGGDIFNNFSWKFNESLAKQAFRMILEGLNELHSKGIMHRDIKPENVLVKSNDEFIVKVSDFGLAAYVNEPKHLYTKCGTPGFIAPEVFKGNEKQYDEKCDIYSAGIIFFTCLFQRVPFYGDSSKEVYFKNKEGQINFEVEKQQNINPLGIDLVKKMLEKDPKKRLSAQEALQHEFFQVSKKSSKFNSEPVSKVLQLIVEEKNNQLNEQALHDIGSTNSHLSPLLQTKRNNQKKEQSLTSIVNLQLVKGDSNEEPACEYIQNEQEMADKVQARTSDYQATYRTVSYTHLRAHETGRNLVCRLLLEKKKTQSI